MTYQDQLIKNAVDALEIAIRAHLSSPCIYNAQKIAEAKQSIMELIKNAK